MNLVVASLIVVIWAVHSTDGSFSSVEKIAATLDEEMYVVKALEALIKRTEKLMGVIKECIEQHRETEDTGLNTVSLVSHPVNGFIIMKRLVNRWKEMEIAKTEIKMLMSDAFTDLNEFRTDIGFPNEKDFNVTTESVIILQKTYDMDVKELSKGQVRGTKDKNKVFKSPWKLSAWDFLHLGKTATSLGRYGIAVSWYQEALRRGGDKLLDEKEIKLILEDAIETHDTTLLDEGPRGKGFSTYNKPFNQYLARRQVYRMNLHTKWYPKLYQTVSDEEDEMRFEKLCRGEELQRDGLRDRLTCRYMRDSHPYFLLRPLKIEERSLDPYIAVIHEFMSDNETDEVIKIGSNQLRPSEYYNEKGERTTGTFRTSLNAWIYQTDVTDKLSRRIGSALALDVTTPLSSEPYQVANYGVGGRYAAHEDYIKRVKTGAAQITGDRLVTFMVYLTDVDAGGATVFPRAGASVWPKRGSAAVWFNLFKNGEGDRDTSHGGCPVIHGTKWIANKWILSNNQMDKVRCSTEYYEKFDASFWNSKSR